MGLMNNIGSLLAMTEPANSGFIAQFIELLFGWIGNYGWTVVVFTLFLKLVLSPLDFWQKHVMHKNMRAMTRMKPQMEKLQKQYAGNKERFQQEQMKLYKKEGYSIWGSCLPMLVTLGVFIFVFSQFNGMATYMVKRDIYEMEQVYQTTIDEEEALGTSHEVAVSKAQDAVVEWYETEGRDSFLWVKNVFMPDNWSNSIPTYEDVIGTLRVPQNEINEGTYTSMTAKLRARPENQGWNGLLILPVMTIAISFLSQLFQKQQMPTPTGDKATQKSQGIMMKVMMPVMMGVFALFYSTAFTIYMFVSQLFSMIFQLVYNLITGIRDKKEDDYKLTHTYK